MLPFFGKFSSNSADVYLALAVLIELLFIYAADISACWVTLASTVGTWHRGRVEGGGGRRGSLSMFHVSFLAEKGCSTVCTISVDIVHDKDDEFSRSRCLFINNHTVEEQVLVIVFNRVLVLLLSQSWALAHFSEVRYPLPTQFFPMDRLRSCVHFLNFFFRSSLKRSSLNQWFAERKRDKSLIALY
jgi:hypothetical protein